MLKALKENELSLISDSWNPEDFRKAFDIEPPEVEWIRCPSFQPFYHHLIAPQWLNYTRKINRLIHEIGNNYDLLIETQQTYLDAPTHIPLINYIHYPTLAAPFQEKKHSFISSVYYATMRFFIRKRIKKISLALTNSQFTARKIKEYLRIEPLVVYPPVDVQKFYSNRRYSERENKVVTVGVFVPWKRLHLFSEIAERLPNIQFVIIGKISKDHRDYYENLCMHLPENLTIKSGEKPFEKEFASAKAYVHLCAEPFGISVVEAAAAGCIPIVYYIGGPAECLDNIALTWQDLPQLSTHIDNLLKNEELWSKLSERAQAKALEFDASIFEQRIRKIIEERLWK